MGNPWTNPVCVRLMPKHRCARETPSFILIPWQKIVWGCSIILARRILWVGRLLFCDFSDWFGRAEDISFWPTVYYIWFSAEHVFPNYFIILYSSVFTFLAIKLPSINYLICDQVTYCMFLHHYITEILLKVVLSTITLTFNPYVSFSDTWRIIS